jgi:hypothetical protein
MLFDLKQIKVGKAIKAKGGGVTVTGNGEAMYLPNVAKKELESAIGELKPGLLVHFYTTGAWSMHELVAYCLRQTGPSRVTLSTWTITETPARCLMALKDDGLITSLSCVIDQRVRVQSPKAHQLLEAISDYLAEARCHAKTVVIDGGRFPITIVASANMTKNPRYEAGSVFTTPEAADFHLNWMNDLCN